MKHFLSCLLLLMISTTSFADNRAITISLIDSSGVINLADMNAINQIIGNAITDGTLDNVLTYKPKNSAKNKFFACVQTNVNTTTTQLTNLVNTLQKVTVQTIARYQLNTISQCNKNETQVCIANPLACFNTKFINSSAYTDYVIKSQFNDIIDALSPFQLLIDLKLNEGRDILGLDDIGLDSMSFYKNCATLSVAGSYADGNATINCTTPKSNLSAISRKRINWIRTGSTGNWKCTTNIAAKYAGNCKAQ